MPFQNGSQIPEREWNKLHVSKVLEELETSAEGLDHHEAQKRLETFGANIIGEEKKLSRLKVILHQFKSPLIYVLLLSMVLTTSLQRWDDTIMIGIILIMNATIGYFQEYKAENAILELMRMVAPKANVKRGGQYKSVDVTTLVPGDIVKLEEGKVVPADVRLHELNALQISEAALTGESVPVSKTHNTLEEDDHHSAQPLNLAFMGTSVTSGLGEGIVVGTGLRTEIGRIAESVKEASVSQTPLQQRMDRLAKWIVVVLIFVIGICFWIGVASGKSSEEMLILSISLAVSAMPEALPIIMSVALAIGVKRMADKHAIVRHLPAVETLGSTTVILSDKTGTITQNKMKVTHLLAGDEILKSEDLKSLSELDKNIYFTLAAGVLNNKADQLDEEKFRGDPMDVAMLVLGQAAGLQPHDLSSRFKKIDEIPFKTENKFSATIHEENGQRIAFIKGAPEKVLSMCDERLNPEGEISSLDHQEFLQLVDKMAEQGLRVLAVAMTRDESVIESLRNEEPHGVTFLGAHGLLDPPRKEAVEAIDMCKKAGIRVMMVTGDHPKTASSIAKSIHLTSVNAPVVTGSDIESLSDAELRAQLRKTPVFARSKPHHKMRLVELLKKDGEIVAVTGDGVNDAPALKASHLGVAMGSGTDVAKEASDMVISDDNFASIFEAVKNGRTAFRNIRMATYFLLSTAVAEVVTIFAALVADVSLPFLPAQILWLNVVTNGFQDVALAFEKGDKSLYVTPPRRSSEGILNWPMVERTIFAGTWFAICTLAVYFWQLQETQGNIEHSRVAAVTTLVILQAFHVFNCRRENESIFKTNLFSNKWLLIGSCISFLHLGAMYWGPTQRLLSLHPLSVSLWGILIAIGSTAILVNEIHKWVCRKKGRGFTSGKTIAWMGRKLTGADRKEMKDTLEEISSKLESQDKTLSKLLHMQERKGNDHGRGNTETKS